MTSTIDGTGHSSFDSSPAPSPRTVPLPPPYGVRGRIARRVLERILRKVPVTARLADGEQWGDALGPVI